LKIVYVASDQRVPGRTGGSVHVLEVARGLAGLGHEVHAVVHCEAGVPDHEERDGVIWHRISWRPDHRLFRFRARAAVERIIQSVKPHALMERYYNFGGEGILAAEKAGLPSLLEVNSPAVDHPASMKAALDALAFVRPLRRRRERLCRAATALVSPLLEIVPGFARAKTARVSWGANVDAFRPSRRRAELRSALGVPDGAVAVLFSGSFRPWHGVRVLEAAARRLTHRADIYFLLAGGPLAAEGAGYRGRRLGSLPYEQMPELVASTEVGTAPYDTRRLRSLRLGFYWSPLKIFEYMASGLPTVTIGRPPLDEIVREEHEGLHFREGDDADLARVLERLAGDAALRARLGSQARARVVENYSWARHCQQLEGVLRGIAR
jgi:glycosyltransferase involved in cell wall biosynthesis